MGDTFCPSAPFAASPLLAATSYNPNHASPFEYTTYDDLSNFTHPGDHLESSTSTSLLHSPLITAASGTGSASDFVYGDLEPGFGAEPFSHAAPGSVSARMVEEDVYIIHDYRNSDSESVPSVQSVPPLSAAPPANVSTNTGGYMATCPIVPGVGQSSPFHPASADSPSRKRGKLGTNGWLEFRAATVAALARNREIEGVLHRGSEQLHIDTKVAGRLWRQMSKVEQLPWRDQARQINEGRLTRVKSCYLKFTSGKRRGEVKKFSCASEGKLRNNVEDTGEFVDRLVEHRIGLSMNASFDAQPHGQRLQDAGHGIYPVLAGHSLRSSNGFIDSSHGISIGPSNGYNTDSPFWHEDDQHSHDTDLPVLAYSCSHGGLTRIEVSITATDVSSFGPPERTSRMLTAWNHGQTSTVLSKYSELAHALG